MRPTSCLIVKSFLFSILAMIGAFCAPIFAQAPGQNNITATLDAETRSPAPGSIIMLAIDMKPKPGWHGYWKNPGDAGFAAELKWDLPKGASVGPVRFPVPEKLVIQGLMNHVYNGEHALLVPLTIPSGLAKGTALPIRLTGDWLACTDQICVPERAQLSTMLTIGDGAISASDRARFDAWRMKLPRPLGSQSQFSVSGNQVQISIPLPASIAVEDPWFFPATDKALSYLGPQKVTRSGDSLTILVAKAGGDFAAPKSLDGVLAFTKGPSGALQGLEISAQPGAVASLGDKGVSTTILAIAGAILGGLILNIMPCVFPVISLKAISLAKAGGDEGAARRDALAYAAGVILTCLALGGALLALRTSGRAVGWAFQLQDPGVVLALLLLTTAIALNLAGLFHLKGFGGGQALASKDGVSGSFWTGALAAFVATPCTGPFMAAALGAALVLPAAAALGIFAGLGFGLALPFLLIGFVPAFRKLMPKPGAWMATFQKWMSVPMFLTAAALLWILGRQTGQAGLVIGAVAALVGAGALWFIGKKQPLGLSFLALMLGVGVVSFAAAAVLPRDVVSKDISIAGAEPFTEARLAALRAEGRPVFAYFTADWCVTCKVNEKAAIERDEVLNAFKAKNVAILVGDWTNGDPALGRFLETKGRSGVPLYLFYPKGKEAEILPQVLTPSMLTAQANK